MKKNTKSAATDREISDILFVFPPFALSLRSNSANIGCTRGETPERYYASPVCATTAHTILHYDNFKSKISCFRSFGHNTINPRTGVRHTEE